MKAPTFLKRYVFSRPFHHLPGYLNRWWVIGGSNKKRDDRDEVPFKRHWWDALIGYFFTIKLHQLLRSDADRECHDHPRGSLSVILKGGYWEIMPKDQNQPPWEDFQEGGLVRVWRGPGSVIFRPSPLFRHRLELPEGKTSWSLFMMMGRRQPWWGFYKPDGKVHYEAYFAERGSEV